jgi:hypothetical protein
MVLSPSQIEAARLLAQGRSHQEVGDAVGVSRRTILRWLKEQDFKNLSYASIGRPPQPPQRASERRQKVYDPLTPLDLVQDALEAVQDILNDPEVRISDRLKAATLVGQWAALGQPNKMAEMEALRVLIEAGWIGDAPVNVLAENLQVLSAEMKDVLRGNGGSN